MKIYTAVCAIAILLASSATGADARVIGNTLDHAVAVYYFDRPTNAGHGFSIIVGTDCMGICSMVLS